MASKLVVLLRFVIIIKEMTTMLTQCAVSVITIIITSSSSANITIVILITVEALAYESLRNSLIIPKEKTKENNF